LGCLKKAHSLEGSGSCTQNYISPGGGRSGKKAHLLEWEWKLYPELYYGYLTKLGCVKKAHPLRGVEAVSRIILWLLDRVGVVKKAHPLEGNGSYIQNYIMTI
jgi:hypothetical protein